MYYELMPILAHTDDLVTDGRTLSAGKETYSDLRENSAGNCFKSE